MTKSKSMSLEIPPTLDSATASFLDKFSKAFASIAHLSIPEQRAEIKEMFCVPKEQLERIEHIENKVIAGRHGPIPVRIFKPAHKGLMPVLIYFHRGGWVYGSLDESEGICRRLANHIGAIVVAVEYRLAPEYKFPVPLEDCYDASKWVAENASSFLGDPNQLILCGESAGGNLAAAVALMVRETKQFSVARQLLIYPALTNELNPEHYHNSPDKSLLSIENMEFFFNAYLSVPSDGNNPYVSPLKEKNFAGLPPCFIITAEYDALKYEGKSYEAALRNAGVPVKIKCYPKVIHGFLDLPLAEDVQREAIKDIGAWTTGLTD